MSIEVYEAGATVEIWFHVKDWEGDAVTPDQGTTITITDPGGTVKVNAQNMTAESQGELVYRYNLASNAKVRAWRYQCKGQDGTGDDARYTIKSGAFRVK